MLSTEYRLRVFGLGVATHTEQGGYLHAEQRYVSHSLRLYSNHIFDSIDFWFDLEIETEMFPDDSIRHTCLLALKLMPFRKEAADCYLRQGDGSTILLKNA